MIEQLVERKRIIITSPAESITRRTGIEARKIEGESADEQLTNLVGNYLLNRFKEDHDKAEYVSIEGTGEEFIESARASLNGPYKDVTQTYFRSVTLIIPNSKHSSDEIDPLTQIRVRRIESDEPPVPPHTAGLT